MTTLPAVQPQPYTVPPDDYADVLPGWLNYLIAAYPAAKLAAKTFAVFEDAFGEIDPAIMRQAARAAVLGQKFFPSVHELNAYVQQLLAGDLAEQWLLPPHLHHRRMSQNWPTCPACGERLNPAWPTCPACADLARIKANEEGRQ